MSRTIVHSRGSMIAALTAGAALLALATHFDTLDLFAQAQGPCDTGSNAIVCENSKPGSPAAEWDVSGAGDPAIQGYATDISYAPGDVVHFKVDTSLQTFKLLIYRMGYYGGLGARLIDDTIAPVAGTSQGACQVEPDTGLVDCSNWTDSATWQVPSNSVSGIYFARLTRLDGVGNPEAGGSHIVFVVRDDTGGSDLLFQTSDTTWQAYNEYGGNSLYTGGPGTNPGRAYKVSYNRPFTTRAGVTAQDWVFNAEYPMVRWLERNGYDVSYFTGVDTDRRGAELLEHRVFLSVGHDEYWSGQQRANVEAARNAGVHLAFFSGNEIFWKTRWERSLDGVTSHRTLVCYKETHENAKLDPSPEWTGTWRDPRFSPPSGTSDGGRPENALSGTLFMVNDGATTAIDVPSAFGALRFWRNTTIAEAAGTTTLSANTLGYEWDTDPDNGFRPTGLIRLSSTTVGAAPVLQDYGSTYASGPAEHNLTLYRSQSSGALVFGAGTVQWSWGLDGTHDRGGSIASNDMQQATVNLLADMGVQPLRLQSDLDPATASADTAAPESAITSPADGASLAPLTATIITGTAQDAGGTVAGVDVSVDGGATWQRATGTTSWSLPWNTGSGGTVNIRSRAFDDSGRIETPTAGVTVSVSSSGGTCPCSIWSSAATPGNPAVNDPAAVELGVKFRSAASGYITGIRYYKSTQNTGTHLGHLWTAGGTLLASATFTGESAFGWQQVSFGAPVAIAANTTYVASYYAPAGFYAGDNNYFTAAVTSGPLTALADGVDGGNGVYAYGASGFPNDSFQASNYWVDVVFVTSIGPDTTPPVVSSVSPSNGASGISTNGKVSVLFNEPMDAATINTSTIELRAPDSSVVPSSVTWSAGALTATLSPSSTLSSSTAYTVVVKGGGTDPRVKDLAGNGLAATFTSTFTTAAPPPPPPDEGPGGPILVVAASSNPFGRYYAEILRAEGLNLFSVTDISLVTPAILSAHDVVILGEMPLTAAQVAMFSDWVTAGGNLIAMRPDKQLAGLLGLTDAAATLSNAYLQVNTATSPGSGIVNATIQFHGTADRYAVNGATTIATLYQDAATATPSPAVTLRAVGAGSGHAAAFTYDLARSVVYTRQGNPAWSGQERDGASPIRSDDLFFGAAANDPQPDWVNLDKVAIPQADEQQRLLANLIAFINQARKPLPRFWYFPRGKKAVVVMTGDDHGSGGTAGRFDIYKSYSPANCSVADWECVRSTSYVYPGTPITDAQAVSYTADGFEVGLHVLTDCADWTPASLESFFASQLSSWSGQFPSVSAPSTNRTHCIAWSDYTTQASVSLNHGIRFDTNYYYWPPAWVNNRPGFFTGSGMPMRFATAAGSMIDVYQATTQMTDESGQSYPVTIDTLLDRALGPEGYYGAFTANMHTDQAILPESDAIVSSAVARGVPIVSARQMLTWLDGRNASSFGNISWSGTTLGFAVAAGAGANRLTGMVPAASVAGNLTALTRGGSPVPYSIETIKGTAYALFEAGAGNYLAVYGGGGTVPTLSIGDVTVAEGHSGTANATFTVTLSAASTQQVTVGYQSANGTATAGSDYTATSGTLTLEPGTTSATIAVPVLADALDEVDETFTVALGSPVNATIAQGVGSGTIVDDDPLPALAIDNLAVLEGNGGTANAAFTVTLLSASGRTVTVNFATANGTATAGSDYTTTSGTLTFAPGITTQTIAVPIAGDTLNELNETFTVTLSAPTNATISTAQGVGTIQNDDPLPALSIEGGSALESKSGNTKIRLTITLAPASGQTVTVGYATADGTATAGSDYQAATGTLTFAPGTTSQTIALNAFGDRVAEPDETFFVNLSNAQGAAITVAQGTATILNDDGAAPSLSINSVSVTEGNSGTTSAVFTVSLSAAASQTVTVNYATADGTAAAGSDYTTTSGTLTFPAGTRTRTITVTVLGDTTTEPNETFTVALSNAANASISQGQGTAIIENDDGTPLPTLSINSQSVPEGNSGTTSVVFTVTLSASPAQTVTVNYSTADATAAAGSDYTAGSGTVTFPAGTQTLTQTFSIAVLGDTDQEPDESFVVSLANPSGAVIATGQGVGTIINDDLPAQPLPNMSIDSIQVSEGRNGRTKARFTVSLSAPSTGTVTVAYTTSPGTATPGSDYEGLSGVLTFAPGTTSLSITVNVLGDRSVEPNETFLLLLSNAQGATITTGQGICVILNDD